MKSKTTARPPLFGAARPDLPDELLPALAQLAGAQDLNAYLNGVAGLLHGALPHEASVLSCQYETLLFLRNGAVGGRALSKAHNPLTAQAVCLPLPPSEAIVVTDGQMVRAGSEAARQGFVHGMAVSIAYHRGFGATAMLYRTAEQGPFDAAGVASMRRLIPICEQALKRLLDQQQARSLQRILIGFLRDLPVGLIMLDWELRPVFVNREGYKQTLQWNHAPQAPPRHLDAKKAFALPDDIRRVCDAFRRRWTNHMLLQSDFGDASDSNVPVTLQHGSREDMRAVITPSDPGGAAGGHDEISEPPRYLIRYFGISTRTQLDFQPSSTQLRLLAQLTPTERSIALLVLQGLSNREIATRLHREVCTVKDHLTHVFDKLSIRSRAQLIRLLS